MLSVLFAVSYQSVHTFSHKHHLKTSCCEHSHQENLKKAEITVTETEDCPVCDFEFVAFLSPEVFHFTFFSSFYEIPYQFNSNESCITFEGNSFYLRGPPVLV